MKYYVICRKEELDSKYYFMLPLSKYKFKFFASLICFYINMFYKDKRFYVKEIELHPDNPTPEELLKSGLLIKK